MSFSVFFPCDFVFNSRCALFLSSGIGAIGQDDLGAAEVLGAARRVKTLPKR